MPQRPSVDRFDHGVPTFCGWINELKDCEREPKFLEIGPSKNGAAGARTLERGCATRLC